MPRGKQRTTVVGPGSRTFRTAVNNMALQQVNLAARRAALRAVAEERAVNRPQRQAPKPARRRVTSASSGDDGLNSAVVHTNTTVIEDTFRLRREKVMDVYGSTSPFTLSAGMYINPGNTTLFPIFSGIAATYEQFRVNTLRFVFETQAYTASGSNLTAGLVGMATNFDPDDPAFVSMTELENYVGSVKGPPYARRIVHDVARAHGLRRGSSRGGVPDLPLLSYFVNPSGNAKSVSGSTSKFYDVGLFQVAAANNAGNGPIGELFVEYSFTMIRPKQPSLTADLGTRYWHGAFTNMAFTASGANLFSNEVSVAQQGLAAAAVSPSTITIPAGVPGRYFVNLGLDLAAGGTNLSASSVTLGLTGGLTLVNAFANPSGAGVASYTAVSNSSQLDMQIVMDATSAGGSIAYGGIQTTAGTAVGEGDVFIMEIPGGLAAQASRGELPRLDVSTLRALMEKPSRVSNSTIQVHTDNVGPSVQPATRQRCLSPVLSDDDDSVYVTDTGALRVRERDFFLPTGSVTQTSSPAQSSRPNGAPPGAIPVNSRSSSKALGPPTDR